jgi:hypothetical protein
VHLKKQQRVTAVKAAIPAAAIAGGSRDYYFGLSSDLSRAVDA